MTVLGRGSRLVGGTVKVNLDRETVRQTLVNGFLPSCGLDEVPHRQPASGFQELGLPYEQDPAITRHLAEFLRRHDAVDSASRPNRLLLNGGVFKADALGAQLDAVLGRWFGDGALQPLSGRRDLDHAVARGAAHYARVLDQGRGVRIRGGVARSYYLGLESSAPAIPGAPRPLRALCVVPKGTEEGTDLDVPGGRIGLVVGQPARFRFFGSTTRDDPPGFVLDRWTDGELMETDPFSASLPANDDEAAGTFVPVHLRSRVTEVGTLELWCQRDGSDERWKMELEVRER